MRSLRPGLYASVAAISQVAALVSGIPDVPNQNANFNTDTGSGAGGWKPIDENGDEVDLASVDSQVGATRTWSIASARLVANGTPDVDDGQQLTLTTTTGKQFVATVVSTVIGSHVISMAELATAFAAATLSDTLEISFRRGLDLTDGARHTLAARAFTGRCTITEDDWSLGANATLTTHTTTLPAITLASGMENVTLQGLKVASDLPSGENASNGAIEVTAPSVGIEVVDCETTSETSLEDRWLATLATGDPGYFVTYEISAPLLRGIVFSSHAVNRHTDIVVDRNYCHDLERGIGAWAVIGGSISDNILLDLYTNTITYACQDVIFKDNYGGHIWAASLDSETPGDPGTLPHASTGPSGDAFPGVGLASGNIFEGGAYFVGWHRHKLHSDNVLSAPSLQVTGAKANDPDTVKEYTNNEWRDVLVVGSGISMQTQAGDDNDYKFCTVAQSPYGPGAGAIFQFGGVENSRLWGCLGNGFNIDASDGGTDDVALGVTLDTLQASDNRSVVYASTDFGQSAAFEGHATKGFLLLEWDEVRAAYKTKTGHTYNTQQLGIGHYYTPGGTGTWPAFSNPVPSTGTVYNSPETAWDGAVRAKASAALTGVADGQAFTLAWEGSFDAAVDASTVYLYANSNSRLTLARLSTGKLRVRAKNAAGDTILEADSDISITSADGLVRIAVAVDLAEGRAGFAVNGIAQRLPKITALEDDDIAISASTTHYINAGATGTEQFEGIFRQFLLLDEFIDLDTSAGLDTLFTAAGEFVDFGVDGSNVTTGAVDAPVCFRGNAATLSGGTGNGGDGGAFAIENGTVTDVGGFTPSWVVFSGNDWLTRGADLTGAADAKTFVLFTTVQFGAAAMGQQRELFTGASAEIVIVKTSTNKIQITVEQDDTTSEYNLVSSLTLSQDTKYGILVSVDTVANGLDLVVVPLGNDAGKDLDASTAANNVNVNLTATNWVIGAASVAGARALEGQMERFQAWFGAYADASVEATQRLFWDASGVLEDPDTAIATLGNPIINRYGDANAWNTAAQQSPATGGDFSVANMSVTDA